MKFSKHQLRDALRIGLQSAVAAGTSFIVMRAFGLPEIFVGALSAVLILSRSVDGSVGAGIDRVLSTVVGSLVGIACLIALPNGFGTAVALGLSVFAVSLIGVLRPNWQYGVVAAVALSLGSEQNLVETSIDRLTAIAIGVAVGILVSLVVWPERAASRYLHYRRAVLTALIARLGQSAKALDGKDDPVEATADRDYDHAYRHLIRAFETKRLGHIPGAEEEIRGFRRIYNSIVILDRVLDCDEPCPKGYGDTIAELRNRLEALRDAEPGAGAAEGEQAGRRLIGEEELDRAELVAFGLGQLDHETGRLAAAGT